jgi:hypothetical protein
MMGGLFDVGPGTRFLRGGLFELAQIKRKIFVSYHHGGDRGYYDEFCRVSCDQYDVIYDNSPERRIDSEDVNYVRRRLSDSFIAGSSCTINLVGRDTWGRKYVDWELDATLDKQHGLIGVQLPSALVLQDGTIGVPLRLLDNIKTGYAVWLNWSQITASTDVLTRIIEIANSKQKYLIDNSRARRYRNAGIFESWTSGQ